MTEYRRNHYVPVWYQERFISSNAQERKFYYLDLKPKTLSSNGRAFTRNSLMRWGPKSCFWLEDLYTTKHGDWISTEIEQKFFGPLDDSARPALDYFSNFAHPSANGDLFHNLLLYMSLQKLRTPKGLKYLSNLTQQANRNKLLIELQRLQAIFCAIWTESVWSIADASQSDVKFILSDHPVTTYNMGCYPQSSWCRNGNDPHIWLNGTHTLFPLTPEKLLILTNLSWVRHPYSNPTRNRPNPSPLRPAMFNFTAIQTGRRLSEDDVVKINYITKLRANRYIAATNKDWLFPEKRLAGCQWNSFGSEYLLMPDPRSVSFSSEIVIGYANNKSDAFDAYGRKPWQADYDDKQRSSLEWETFHAFQGEFARRFGPKRRGVSFEFGRVAPESDAAEMHAYYLSLEANNKKHRYR
jgi:hypothetical protein